MTVSRRLRYEVLRRDDFTCRYCGGRAPAVRLTVDHVIPEALGGSDDPTNLVAACEDCNSGKSSSSPDERLVAEVSDSALLYARAIDQVARVRSQEFSLLGRRANEFKARWDEWKWGNSNPVPIDPAWRKSVEHFLTRGLTVEDLHYFVDVAMQANTNNTQYSEWKYFCGCCWKEINARVDAALALIEAGEVE